MLTTLPPRWRPLRPHPVQSKLWRCPARFIVVEAGRRSGKSELAKRKGVSLALTHLERSPFDDGLYVFAAPTRDQVKQIYWQDLKAMVPKWALARAPQETDLRLELKTGCAIQCVGMDRPQRIEGRPIDWFAGDEMQEWRPGIYDRNVRPALETPDRPGSAWFYGVPRPGAEFETLCKLGKSGKPDWAYFTWTSEGLISAESLATARETMDERIYAQEFLAQRVSLQGRAYYTFDRATHYRESLPYNPNAALHFCFDFNVEPGIAVVAQEQAFRTATNPRADRPEVADTITAYIGEVWIPHDSRTEFVLRKLIADWGSHRGAIICYGDASGGARHTSQGVEGSDWNQIRDMLNAAFPGRVHIRKHAKNPPERNRVNALCSRLRSADGKVHTLVDPKCKNLADDLDGVMLLAGGSGEIDKKRDPKRTHMTDAIGYKAEFDHGGQRVQTFSQEIY